MASEATRVIAAAIDNNDVQDILAERSDLFGSVAPEFLFLKDYYTHYRVVPSREVMAEKFPDTELPATNGATKHYLNSLRDQFIKGGIARILQGANKDIDSYPGAEIKKTMQAMLRELDAYDSSAKDVNMNDVEAARLHMDALRNASDDDRPGIKTGFDSIDASYPTGLLGGQLAVVFGYSGHGKSLFTAKLAINIWKQRKKVLIFSLEMSPEEYRERVYTLLGEGSLSMTDLARGTVTSDKFEEFAGKHLLNADDMIVVSNEGLSDITPSLIQAKIDTYKPDFVLLDYAQLFMDEARSEGMTPRMMNFSREAKLLATSNGIPVMLISAITDDEGKKRKGLPHISQIAWSRGIEYDASLAIAVHKHEDTDLIEIGSRKVRNGKPFHFVLQTDIENGIWHERDRSVLVV